MKQATYLKLALSQHKEFPYQRSNEGWDSQAQCVLVG